MKNTIFATSLNLIFMKKILTLIFAIMLSLNVKAQCTITEAVDFTAVECYGQDTINLFEILDRGQYVLIDFFFANCTPCFNVCPEIVEAYKALGCNKHDIFFMEISHADEDWKCQWWAEKFGVEYPSISKEFGGVEIREAYGPTSFPTFVLISPDRKILLQDIDCFAIIDNGYQYLIDVLAEFGIEEHSCDDPAVNVSLDDVTARTVTATFTPIATCATYHFMIGTESEMEQYTAMFGMPLEDLVVSWGIEKNETYTHTWTEQIPNTEYTIYVIAKDADGNVLGLEKTKVSTSQLGGTGVSVIDMQVEVLSDTSVFVTAAPNEETAEYHYILIEKNLYDVIGVDSTLQILYQDPYTLYEVDEHEWSGLNSGTEFLAVAQGKNANGEWGEVTTVEFKTTGEGAIELVENKFNIFPNPASSEIRITSEMTGETEINIFDLTGRKVKTLRISDISKATVNINDIEKGIYLININGYIEKLIKN